MKIAFIDPADSFDYNPMTPLQKPLGGTQSAICYLASELSKLGHDITLINWISSPGVYQGIACPGWQRGFTKELLGSADVIIAVNVTMGTDLRQMIGPRVPMVLWAHHATSQPAVAKLRDKEEQTAWSLIALISDWQKQEYIKSFNIDPDHIAVLRNAISPAFEKRQRTLPLFYHGGTPPTLIYTSTPFRGLDVLLLAFPAIRRQVADCRLIVFSGMDIYGVAKEKDDYRVLYELCHALDGVEHKGVVGQADLAEEIFRADILAYPNTFPETSCIAVMEAMAAGCLILTSKLAALPETTAGFGFHLPVTSHPALHAGGFSRMVIEICHDAFSNRDKFDRLIEAQMNYARTEYSWSTRAREWERILLTLSK